MNAHLHSAALHLLAFSLRPQATSACSGCGCHVLETLLRRLVAGEQPMEPEAQEAVRGCVDLVKDDLTAYIADRHATYLARNLVHLLTGQLKADAHGVSTRAAAHGVSPGLPRKLERIESLSGRQLFSNGARDAPVANGNGNVAAGMPDAATLLRQLLQATLACTGSKSTLRALQRSHAASGFLQVLIATDATQCAPWNISCQCVGLAWDALPIVAMLLWHGCMHETPISVTWLVAASTELAACSNFLFCHDAEHVPSDAGSCLQGVP